MEVKRHIREFCGFDFKPDSEQFEKRKELLHKHHLPELKILCEILDLDKKGGTKDEIVVNILNFLVEPTDSGRKVIKKGDKKKKKKQTKTPTKKAAASPSAKSPNKSKAEVSDEESDSESNSSESQTEQNDKETIESAPSILDKKAVTVKAGASTPKSTTRKKIVARTATTHPARKIEMPTSSASSVESESEDRKASEKQVKKAPPTPESSKKLSKKKKLVSDEDSTASDIENEIKKKRAKTVVESPTKEVSPNKTPKLPESPAKKVVVLASKVCKKANNNETKEASKPTPKQDEKEAADNKEADSQPTDADFRKTIEKILETANLEAVTMKTVVKDVYSKYPHVKEAFLNSKKDFIKQVVREVSFFFESYHFKFGGFILFKYI